MIDVVFVLVTFSLLLIDIVVAQIYSESIELLLQKNGRWVYFFFLWIGILFLQAALFSWLPGRVGGQITLFEGTIVFEDGALIRNLGFLLLAHVVGIGLAILKYLWNVIRKVERFNGKMVLLEVVICCVCCFLAARLMESEYVIHFTGGESAGKIVLAILALTGAGLIIWSFRQSRTDKAEEKGRGHTGKSAESQRSPEEDLQQFEKVVAARKRLTEQGDYASQIPLLIEATGLNVDATRKSRIWNYMGLAYNGIGSVDKAEESFRTAQSIDPGHPSSYINLAMYYLNRGDYGQALQNADTAIEKAKRRKMSLGQFYANKALIIGLSGDRAEAVKYLRLAREAGCDEKEIRSIQNRLRIH